MAIDPPIHASCVAIGGLGILILGPSGSGKSDLALRLIDRGAILVSDDYTQLVVLKEALFASPPPNIAGKMEVRGVGIIEREFLPQAQVALTIDLEMKPERLPRPETRDFLGVPIPVIAINPFEASAPIKVELALSRLKA
jgi:serine kinase of HPr protein (carbohydrate metabolism regulator)